MATSVSTVRVSGNGSPADANLDFLEGAMNSFTQSLAQQNALRGSMPTIYGQDTFHATFGADCDKITAGLRWEPLFVPHDYFHRGSEFSLTGFLANQTSAVYPQAPPGTFYYGDKGVSANFTKNSPLEFSPKLRSSLRISLEMARPCYAVYEATLTICRISFSSSASNKTHPSRSIFRRRTPAQSCASAILFAHWRHGQPRLWPDGRNRCRPVSLQCEELYLPTSKASTSY